jgi:hypothetical protein
MAIGGRLVFANADEAFRALQRFNQPLPEERVFVNCREGNYVNHVPTVRSTAFRNVLAKAVGYRGCTQPHPRLGVYLRSQRPIAHGRNWYPCSHPRS